MSYERETDGAVASAPTEPKPSGEASICPEVPTGKSSVRHVAAMLVEALKQSVGQGDDHFASLPEVDDCVYVKNGRGVLVYCNDAHRDFFCDGQTPLGRTAHTYLQGPLARRAEMAEELLLSGCPYVECEHTAAGPDGAPYRMRAHKRSLAEIGAPGLAILGVIRIVGRDDTAEATERLDMPSVAERFKTLSERDQEICRLTALGVSSRELGDRLGMTTRGIELRKQKAFAHLGVAKAVDLARLLVRLQDRGYCDLGL